MTDDILAWIQQWYAMQCDGDWEHRFGVKIETLDNPGWAVAVDLEGTCLEDMTFTPVEHEESEDRWVVCKVESGQFKGYGGPHDLGRLLGVFRSCVQTGDTKE